jgi:hypothetical protein
MGWLLILVIIFAIFWHLHPLATGLMLAIGVVVFLVVEYATRKSDNNIVSATVVGRTRFMRNECEPSGFSMGLQGHHRVYWRFRQVPSHIAVTVDVVYENGKHGQLILTEGSGRYNRIVSICEKRKQISAQRVSVLEKSSEPSTNNVNYVDIKTNQLVAGVYVIGELIPEGNYDFRWIWGSGRVEKHADSTCTYNSETSVTASIGNTMDYEERVLVNVVCKAGEYLIIKGNVIVEIRKSKSVVLDL